MRTARSIPAIAPWFDWDIGLVVRDWRQVVRVGNIDLSALSSTADDLVPKMIEAWYRLHDPKAGRVGVFMNRRIAMYLHLQARKATSPAHCRWR